MSSGSKHTKPESCLADVELTYVQQLGSGKCDIEGCRMPAIAFFKDEEKVGYALCLTHMPMKERKFK